MGLTGLENGSDTGLSDLGHIQTSSPGPVGLTQVAWICAGTNLSSPVEMAAM